MLIIFLVVLMTGTLLGLLFTSLLSLGNAVEEAKEWEALQGRVILAADSYYQDPLPYRVKKISWTPR